MGALGWLLRLNPWTRRSLRIKLPSLSRPVEIPAALVAATLVYGLLAFVACKALSIIPRLTYDLAALLLTYVAVGWAIRWPPGSDLAATHLGTAVRPQRVA
jgi:hypothetical protein